MEKEKLRSEIDDKYKWDLTRIFKDDNEAFNNIEKLKKLQSELLNYKGKIAKSSDHLYKFLKLYDEASIILNDLVVYFIYGKYQMNSIDSVNQKNKVLIDNLVNDFYEDMSFIDNEIINSDYKELLNQDNRLLEYDFYLNNLSRFKSHILNESEEKLLASLQKVMGCGYEIYNSIMYTDVYYGKIKDKNGKVVEVNNSNYSKLLCSSDRSLRKKTYQKKYKYYQSFSNTITNSILQSIKESEITSKIRGFKNALDQDLFNDNVSLNVYHNLIDSVSNNTLYLKKYYDIKRKLLGYKNLYFYDFSVMPNLEIKNNINYDEAISQIKAALSILGEDYSFRLNEYLNHNLIDVYPNKGKNNGGYEIGLYHKGPFISYNFTDSYIDMFGLAHEIGHAMHSHYSMEKQPYIYFNYKLFTAEVASLTNEVILLEYLIKKSKNKKEKIFYLMKQIEEIDHYLFNVVIEVEQEKLLHEAQVNNNALSTDEIMDNYKKLKIKYYQSQNVKVTDDDKYAWMRHFQYHVSYYFYKYAVDMIIALVIGKRIINNEDNFRNKYIEFLSSGSSKYPTELFKDLGIDIEDISIYNEAIEYFNSRVVLLEQLLHELK